MFIIHLYNLHLSDSTHMNATVIAQMSVSEINSTLNKIKSQDPSFDPVYDQIDMDPDLCEGELEEIIPIIFKWYNLYYTNTLLDMIIYHITIQHRYTVNKLESNDEYEYLPEVMSDIREEVIWLDELSDADTDQED